MTQLQNSAFKMKMGTVPFVGDILPEPGAMVVSDHDGHIYYADKYGWHKADGEYSPITLFVDFNGVDQFAFTFKAPLGSTLKLYDGDGTETDTPGADDTEVIHTTNYAEAGQYVFTAGGDYLDITYLKINSQYFVSGDIQGWVLLPNLTEAVFYSTNLRIDLDLWKDAQSLEVLTGFNAQAAGSLESLKGVSTLTYINFLDDPGRPIHINGDIGDLQPLSSMEQLRLSVGEYNPCLFTFNNSVDLSAWTVLTYVNLQNNGWPSKYVDNALISFATSGISGGTISIAGNNAKRTSRSDDALATLIAAGNTVTVNE